MGELGLTHGGQYNGAEVLGTEHTRTLSTRLSTYTRKPGNARNKLQDMISQFGSTSQYSSKGSLILRPHFSHPPEEWVLSTAYSIFVQACRNAGALFFLIQRLTSSKIAFHTACQLSSSEMDVDCAALAAAYILGYSTFRKEQRQAVSDRVAVYQSIFEFTLQLT